MDNKHFLISVIIPVYNAEQYLRRCIDSVANQTYTNLEIICVNDGSTDNSGKILDEYAANDKRFRVIHQPNGGQASARNAALNCATGDLIANLDSDDYLELHAYETVIKNFDDDIDMIWFGNHIVGDLDEKHMAQQRKFYQMSEQGTVPLSSIPIVARSGAVWNKVVKRSIIEKYHLRYPVGVIFEDLCFFACLAPMIDKVKVLQDQLYFYWQREDSTMGIARSKASEKSRDALNIIPPMYNFYKEHKLFASHRELYNDFFAKFFSLANKFLPSDLQQKLLKEVDDFVEKYCGGNKNEQTKLRNRLLQQVFKQPTSRSIRFLGIPIYTEKKSPNYKLKKLLGVKIYERSTEPNVGFKKTLFYRDTPRRKSYCLFGIPIYTRMKDATRAKKLFGITFSKKKGSKHMQQPMITAKISYLSPNKRLEGKNIIVTGGGRGLGYSMAEKFISEGAKVLIAGRNAELLKEKAEILGCKYLALDVTDVHALPDFMQQAEDMLGGVNCLVNNAGVSLHETNIRTVTPEGFDTQINTNLKGSYFLAQQFIKLVESKQRKDCSIIFISSERGLFVDDIPYGLTKAAINSLVQGLAVRVLPSGIRVNAVAPGVTASEMTGFTTDGNLYCGYNADKRVFLPEEVSETACFLLSDCSRCMTGQILACDQGRAINPHWRRN